jgi:hypothetical protein
MCRELFVSAKVEFDSRGSFGALFSGLGIPFPGNGDGTVIVSAATDDLRPARFDIR